MAAHHSFRTRLARQIAPDAWDSLDNKTVGHDAAAGARQSLDLARRLEPFLKTQGLSIDGPASTEEALLLAARLIEEASEVLVNFKAKISSDMSASIQQLSVIRGNLVDLVDETACSRCVYSKEADLDADKVCAGCLYDNAGDFRRINS